MSKATAPLLRVPELPVLVVPDGFVLMPRDANRAMEDAWWLRADAEHRRWNFNLGYHAMQGAAPQPRGVRLVYAPEHLAAQQQEVK